MSVSVLKDIKEGTETVLVISVKKGKIGSALKSEQSRTQNKADG